MIFKNKLNIGDIRKSGYPLKMVYRKGYLVWSKDSGEGAKSCFGNGYWVNSLPWLNSDGWKNN